MTGKTARMTRSGWLLDAAIADEIDGDQVERGDCEAERMARTAAKGQQKAGHEANGAPRQSGRGRCRRGRPTGAVSITAVVASEGGGWHRVSMHSRGNPRQEPAGFLAGPGGRPAV